MVGDSERNMFVGVLAVELTRVELLTHLGDFEDTLVYPIRIDRPSLTAYVAPSERPALDVRPSNMTAVRALVETLDRYNITPRIIVRVANVDFMAYPDVVGMTLVMRHYHDAVMLRLALNAKVI